MENKEYRKPEIDVITFNSNDVIATSGETPVKPF